jgi:uncharacterized membrane protein YphA (DoxX/SURF4 family)
VWEKLFKDKLGPLTLRVAVGLVGVYHGFLKIRESGGTEWASGLNVGWQLLIAWGQLAAGVAVLVGFRCRIAVGVLLATTVATVLWWQGWGVVRLPLRSLEPLLVVVLSALALLFVGAGEFAVGGGGGRALAPRKRAG